MRTGYRNNQMVRSAEVRYRPVQAGSKRGLSTRTPALHRKSFTLPGRLTTEWAWARCYPRAVAATEGRVGLPRRAPRGPLLARRSAPATAETDWRRRQRGREARARPRPGPRQRTGPSRQARQAPAETSRPGAALVAADDASDLALLSEVSPSVSIPRIVAAGRRAAWPRIAVGSTRRRAAPLALAVAHPSATRRSLSKHDTSTGADRLNIDRRSGRPERSRLDWRARAWRCRRRRHRPSVHVRVPNCSGAATSGDCAADRRPTLAARAGDDRRAMLDRHAAMPRLLPTCLSDGCCGPCCSCTARTQLALTHRKGFSPTSHGLSQRTRCRPA